MSAAARPRSASPTASRIIARAEGAGAAVRPGRALASAAVIAEVVRQALAGAGRLSGDVLYVGAAGAGREPERDELRKALRGENLAPTVVVTTDIEIALAAAFDDGPGIVVSAGTGSVAVGRDRAGQAAPDRRLRLADGRRGQRLRHRPGRARRGESGRRRPEPAHRAQRAGARRSPGATTSMRWCAGRRARRRRRWRRSRPHVLDVAAHGDPLAQGIADYAARELTPARHLPAAADGPRAAGRRGAHRRTAHRRRTAAPERARPAPRGPGLTPIEARVDAVEGAIRLAGKTNWERARATRSQRDPTTSRATPRPRARRQMPASLGTTAHRSTHLRATPPSSPAGCSGSRSVK